MHVCERERKGGEVGGGRQREERRKWVVATGVSGISKKKMKSRIFAIYICIYVCICVCMCSCLIMSHSM